MSKRINPDAVAHDIANRVHPSYRGYTSREDITSEIHTYIHGAGKTHLEKWVEDDDDTRVYKALHAVARSYCEQEKAHRTGYEPGDVSWYAPAQLADLIPLALDSHFTGYTGDSDDGGRGGGTAREGGGLLAAVIDVRRALDANPVAAAVVRNHDTGDDFYDALDTLADWLGGEFPEAPGYRRGRRRRARSNAAAQSETALDWGSV